MLPTPGLPSFDYIRPASQEEVTRLLLRSNGEARLFMGGTDVFVRMRDGFLSPKLLIDVKRLPGMTAIRFSQRTGLTIGAGADMNSVARHPAVVESYPLLAQAIESVASYPVRTRATMGGNLCNASPAADTAPAAWVLGAKLSLHGRRGERVVPVQEFFTGPGKTALRPGEFLTRIHIPRMPAGAVGRYMKLGRNAHGDLAIVGVAVLGYPDPKAKSGVSFRIALASVAPTPIGAPAAERILAEAVVSPDTIEAAARAAAETAKPISDVRSSAEYRRAMVHALTKRAIEEVWDAVNDKVRRDA